MYNTTTISTSFLFIQLFSFFPVNLCRHRDYGGDDDGWLWRAAFTSRRVQRKWAGEQMSIRTPFPHLSLLANEWPYTYTGVVFLSRLSLFLIWSLFFVVLWFCFCHHLERENLLLGLVGVRLLIPLLYCFHFWFPHCLSLLFDFFLHISLSLCFFPSVCISPPPFAFHSSFVTKWIRRTSSLCVCDSCVVKDLPTSRIFN